MLTELSREEFIENYWNYEDGEHVLGIAPTGGGKTHLMYSLLGATMADHPHLSVISFMPKSTDPSTVEWAEKLNLRETPTWPPRKKISDAFGEKPAGHVLWPPHNFSLPPEDRRENVGAVLRHGLNQQYSRGNSISFVDDAHSSATMMGLNSYIEEILVNGRAGGSGMWLATQKPSGTVSSGSLSTFAYSSASHLFLGKDTDERNLKRFGEIGGIDPKFVEETVRNLPMTRINDHPVTSWLYLNKSGPYAAIIHP